MATVNVKRFPSDTPVAISSGGGSTSWSSLTGTPTALLLDQTSPQSVINGSPEFKGGITIKAGQKLIFDGS